MRGLVSYMWACQGLGLLLLVRGVGFVHLHHVVQDLPSGLTDGKVLELFRCQGEERELGFVRNMVEARGVLLPLVSSASWPAHGVRVPAAWLVLGACTWVGVVLPSVWAGVGGEVRLGFPVGWRGGVCGPLGCCR